MSKKSNSALEKYNKETPESVTRKAYKQMVDDEFNDARKQVIRRQFDQVGLYNEIFDKNRISMGNTLVEFELNEVFNNFLQSIKDATKKLTEKKESPFDGIISAYSILVGKLASNVRSEFTRSIDVKAWTDALRNTAPELQNLLYLSMQPRDKVKKILDLVEAKAEGASEKIGKGRAHGRARGGVKPTTDPEINFPPIDRKEGPPLSVKDTTLDDLVDRAFGPNNSAQSGAVSASEIYPTVKDLVNLYLLIEKISVGFIQGGFQGYDTLSPEEKKKYEQKIMQFYGSSGFYKDVAQTLAFSRADLARIRATQPGAIRNRAEYDYAIANLEALKKEALEETQQRNYKELGSYRPNEPQELAKIAKYYDDAIEQVKSNWVSRLPVMDNVDANLPQVEQNINVLRRRGRPSKSEPEQQTSAEISDADKIRYFGQWFSTLTQAQKEALPVFDDVDHAYRVALENRAFEGFGNKRGKGKTSLSASDLYWIMKALGGGKAHGKAHGGQAGFSMDKTREIVDQWPNFPYYVPPSSKTGPMLTNPRSRVHIPTEGNGKPKRGRPAKGGILPVVALVGKQIVKHVVKDQIKKGIKGAIQGKPGNPNTMPPPTSSPQANAHYCSTRRRQGIKDPACGGILPVVALVGKQIAKHALKEGVKHGVKSLSEGKLSHNTDTMGLLNEDQKQSPEADAFYCRTRARQGIKDPRCGGAKKKAKKRGKPSYDVI